MSVEQIKTAIEQLSFEERPELAAWFHGWKDDEWDEQMKRDIAGGRLDDVLREVEEDIARAASVRAGLALMPEVQDVPAVLEPVPSAAGARSMFGAGQVSRLVARSFSSFNALQGDDRQCGVGAHRRSFSRARPA
jgi:hypothetical protein